MQVKDASAYETLNETIEIIYVINDGSKRMDYGVLRDIYN